MKYAKNNFTSLLNKILKCLMYFWISHLQYHNVIPHICNILHNNIHSYIVIYYNIWIDKSSLNTNRIVI